MRLEQGPRPKKNAKKPATPEASLAPSAADYPSARYFQAHFQQLYDLLECLQEQLREANRQIAAHNQALRDLSLAQPAESAPAHKHPAAHGVHEPPRPHARRRAAHSAGRK